MSKKIKKPEIRQSWIRMHAQCPLRAQWQYGDKRPEPLNALAVIGEAVHSMFDRYVMGLAIVHQGKDSALAQQTAANALTDFAALFAKAGADPQEAKNVFLDFASANELNALADPGITALVEHPMSVELDNCTITGTADLVLVPKTDLAPAVSITDYKSGYRIENQAEVERDVQLRTYAWLYAKTNDVERIALTMLFLRWGVPVSYDMGRDEALDYDDTVVGLVKEILGTDHPATSGPQCSHCPWPKDCPAGLCGDLPDVIDSPTRLLDEIVQTEARLKAAKKELKGFCDARGAVVSNGMQAVFVPVHRKRYGSALMQQAVTGESVSTTFKIKEVQSEGPEEQEGDE